MQRTPASETTDVAMARRLEDGMWQAQQEADQLFQALALNPFGSLFGRRRHRGVPAMMGGGGLMGGLMGADPFALLDQLASRDLLASLPTVNRLVPIEVEEKENEYALYAEVPGLTKDDIKITLEPTSRGGMPVLTITGFKTTSTESKEGEGTDAKRSTRCSCAFTRSLELPQDVDLDGSISATTKDGVLNLVLPKLAGGKKTPKPREITIN